MDDRAGRAVTCVGDDFDAAIQFELRRNLVHVRRDSVGGSQSSLASIEIAALDDVEDFLDGFAVQRARAADAFESVVLRRVVAAGDHDRAVGVQVLRRVIEHRSGDRADVGDVAPDGQQASDERIAQARGAEAAIAADVDVCATAVSAQVRAEASSKLFDVKAQKFDVRNAPDVVLPKDGRLEHTI